VTVGSSSTTKSHRDPLTIAFWLLILASLLPIWAFTYFPSQDGPSHLNNANILRLYPWRDLEVFREFYTINAFPFPNWTTHLLLAALMGVFPPLIAEKLFLSAYVISLPLAFRYCIRGINPAAQAGAFLVFPLIYHLLFQKGYYNFSMSIVLFFVCVGYWLRHRDNLNWRRTATLAALFLLLYFSHLVSTTLACATIGLLWMWFIVVELRQPGETEPLRRKAVLTSAAGVAIRTLFAVLPAVLLGLWYLHHQGTQSQGSEPVTEKFQKIFTTAHAHKQHELLVWIPWEVSLLGLALFVLLARVRTPVKGPVNQDGPLLALAIFFLIYLAVPSEIGGGGGIEPRIVLYLWLTLALWLGIQTYSKTIGRAVAVVTGAVTLVLVAIHCGEYWAIDNYLSEYMSAGPFIEPGSTLLSMDLEDTRGIQFVHPFKHAAGYLAAQKNVVDFTNYEAGIDYFPVHFLPASDPYKYIGDAEERPYVLDMLDYSQRSGRSLDYVLLWGGNRPQMAARPDVQSILGQLREGYEQIYVSPQHGLVRLYRRKQTGNRTAIRSAPAEVTPSSAPH
jgi:hypothetical protein